MRRESRVTIEPGIGTVIRAAILKVLEHSADADLCTLYRACEEASGAAHACAVAETIAAMVRDGEISIDTVLTGRDGRGPVVGRVRLNPGRRPPASGIDPPWFPAAGHGSRIP